MSSYQYIKAGEKSFKGILLDNLLALGFYRMQHLMFTCNDAVISNEGETIPMFWLRTLVNKCKISDSAKSIIKKCNRFSINIEQAYIDDEVEELYNLYKEHVAFSVSDTCSSYLHQHEFINPFESMMIKIRDNNLLIAAGFFDKGFRSIAGIINIYHPQYKTFSLGKLLMLQKLNFAQSQSMLFYYTGYISTGSTRFDYKTFPDVFAVEVLLPVEQQWIPYHSITKNFLIDYYTKFLASNKNDTELQDL